MFSFNTIRSTAFVIALATLAHGLPSSGVNRLVGRDDPSCNINGYGAPTKNGIADARHTVDSNVLEDPANVYPLTIGAHSCFTLSCSIKLNTIVEACNDGDATVTTKLSDAANMLTFMTEKCKVPTTDPHNNVEWGSLQYFTPEGYNIIVHGLSADETDNNSVCVTTQ